MGGLGRLSDFGRTSQSEPASPPEQTSQPKSQAQSSTAQQQAVSSKPVTINIKIERDQHEWLSDTARVVRDNNEAPVAPGDRVFPQHLIGVAVDLLRSNDVDWSKVKTAEDLKRILKL